jgi:hypothetical protein
MRKLTLLTLGAAGLILAACATATPYQASVNSSSGYSEQSIESNRYRVSFSGNSLTKLETVENYLLYRAAELTKQSGYDYFVIADRNTEKKERYSSTGFGSSFGYGGHYGFGWSYYSPHYGYGFGYDPFFDGYDIRQITRYTATAEIAMYRGAKPAKNARAYQADEVLKELGTKIVRPEDIKR